MASVYTSRLGPETLTPTVLVAVWSSGRVVWSSDDVLGGPPYYECLVDPDAIQTVLSVIDADGVLENPVAHDTYCGLDIDYTTIDIVHGSRSLHMSSPHEIYERRGNAIATSYGVVYWSPLTTEEIRESEPPEYREFREVWDRIREDLRGLVPAEGAPLRGFTADWLVN